MRQRRLEVEVFPAAEQGLADGFVREVGDQGSHDHQRAHDEQPDNQRRGDGGAGRQCEGQKRDQRHTRHPVSLEASAVGPTESPALSPVQSAMTPGFLGSSSGSLKTIFIRSDPMSAILVKMPPQMRSTLAPSDSPMANPMKHGPTSSRGRNIKMQIMKNSSTATSSRPTLMPERSGIPSVASGLPLSAENAVRELETVLMRMPNHATP